MERASVTDPVTVAGDSLSTAARLVLSVIETAHLAVLTPLSATSSVKTDSGLTRMAAKLAQHVIPTVPEAVPLPVPARVMDHANLDSDSPTAPTPVQSATGTVTPRQGVRSKVLGSATTSVTPAGDCRTIRAKLGHVHNAILTAARMSAVRRRAAVNVMAPAPPDMASMTRPASHAEPVIRTVPLDVLSMERACVTEHVLPDTDTLTPRATSAPPVTRTVT